MSGVPCWRCNVHGTAPADQHARWCPDDPTPDLEAQDAHGQAIEDQLQAMIDDPRYGIPWWKRAWWRFRSWCAQAWFGRWYVRMRIRQIKRRCERGDHRVPPGDELPTRCWWCGKPMVTT